MNNYTLYFVEGNSRVVTQQSHGHLEDMTPNERVIYWTSKDADKGQMVKQCATCLEYQCTQPQETAVHYVIPYKP